VRPTRWILILVLFGLAVALLTFSRDREARYGGRTLSDWVDRYQRLDASADAPETLEVLEAIRRIGTNHLHELIRAMAYDPAARRKRATALGHALPGFLRRPALMGPLLTDRSEFHANRAVTALVVLGPEAGRALPELARMVEDTNSAVVARRAMWVLVHVGNQGMPPLMTLLGNRQHPHHVFAVDYIGDFGTQATGAIPALVEALEDPDLAVRLRATNSLKKVAPGRK